MAVIFYFVAGILALAAFVIFVSYFGTWLQAQASSAHISFWRLLIMSLRQVPDRKSVV